jgi:DNA polymerase III epsilon subunit-like protein
MSPTDYHELVAIDTETTGLKGDARVVEVAVVRLPMDGSPRLGWVRRCNPGIPMPPEAQAINGISDADLVGEPPFAELLEPLIERLAKAELVVGHNISFDVRLLLQSGLPADRLPAVPCRAVPLYEGRGAAAEDQSVPPRGRRRPLRHPARAGALGAL